MWRIMATRITHGEAHQQPESRGRGHRNIENYRIETQMALFNLAKDYFP